MEDRGRPAGAWAVVPGGGEVVQKERVLHCPRADQRWSEQPLGRAWAPFLSSGTRILRLNGTSCLSQTSWVLTLAPPLTGCVILGTL